METTQLLVDGTVRQRKKCKLAKHVCVVQYLCSAVGAKAFMCFFIASAGAAQMLVQLKKTKKKRKRNRKLKSQVECDRAGQEESVENSNAEEDFFAR